MKVNIIKIFICWSLLPLFLFSFTKKIIVVDFIDLSNFKSKWDLSKGLTFLLKKEFNETQRYYLIEGEKVEKTLEKLKLDKVLIQKEENLFALACELNADVIIGGKIKKFNVDKTGIYSPMIAGAKRFFAQVEIALWIYEKAKREKILEKNFSQEDFASYIIATPFSLPDPERDKRNELYVLKEMEFVSLEFNQTLIGTTINKLNKKIVKKVSEIIPSEEKKEVKLAKVLFIDKDDIYISLGTEDKIKVGDKLIIYSQGEEFYSLDTNEIIGYTDKEIGEVEVVMIKGANLCRTKLIKGKAEKGNMVGKK